MTPFDPTWLLYALPVVGLLLIGLAGAAATLISKALEHWRHKGE